jgi:flagellar secretion chaperone FliS
MNHAANQYLRSKVLTATPEQLQLMLYDGAIRFTEQGKAAIEAKNFEASYNAISKAQKIITELLCTLKPSIANDVCKNLAGLYNFCYRKLVDANLTRDIGALDEALQILRYQRETWHLLMQQIATQKASQAAMKLDMPAPNARMEASISFQG